MSLTKVSFSMIEGAVLNVLDYGADRTGIADSSSAIQDAIDALDQTGFGGIVFLPWGDYKCNTGLSLPNLVRLVGEGMDSSNLRYEGNGSAITLPGSVGDNVVKAGLKNLSVYGNNSSQYGINAQYSTDCVFENIRLYNHNIGLLLNWSYNNMLYFVKSDNCRQDGFYFSDEANANTMVGCMGVENARAGLFMHGGRANEAVNCTWEANDQYGIYLLGDTDAIYRPKSLLVSNCYIEGNGTVEVFCDKTGTDAPLGISIKDTYFCALTGKATQAIRVENCEGFEIDGCTFDDQGVPYAYSLYVPAGGLVTNLTWGFNTDRSTGKVYSDLPIRNLIKSTAQATAQFSGKSSVTINSSYNIVSIVRNSAGNYTVTLQNAMPTMYFSVSANAEDNSSGTPSLTCGIVPVSTSQFLLSVTNAAGTPTDGRNVSVIVF